jgi:hypothetical protein
MDGDDVVDSSSLSTLVLVSYANRIDRSKGGRPTRLPYPDYLAMTLYFLRSKSDLNSVAMIFACTTQTCCRQILSHLHILATVLPNFPECRIEWPNTNNVLIAYANLIENKYPGHYEQMGKQCIGFMDGCSFPVQSSSDLTLQEQYYNAYYGGTKVSNLFVWAPDGTIIHSYCNCPGVMHDSTVAATAYELITNLTPNQYGILADTAFPNLNDRIITPLLGI